MRGGAKGKVHHIHETKPLHFSSHSRVQSQSSPIFLSLWYTYLFCNIQLYCDMHACLRPLLSNGPSQVNSVDAC
jgi:hypothetical protein